MYTNTIPLGGITLEENILKSLKVRPDEADDLKKKVGLNKKERGGRVFAALVPAISALAG